MFDLLHPDSTEACQLGCTDSEKGIAVRQVVYLGTIPLTVYKLPTGEYVLGIGSVTESIKKGHDRYWDFLDSKSLQALSCKGWRNSPKTTIPVPG